MLRITVALALMAVAQSAHAQTWADFEGAFPIFPCQDGWMGCLVDGGAVTPDLREDASGIPVAADLRIGWFDLDATENFSPFKGLSEYTGEEPGAAVADLDDGGGEMIEDDPIDEIPEIPEDFVPSEENVAAQEAAEEADAAQAAAAAETRAAEEEAERQRQAADAAAAEKAEQDRKQREAEEAAKNAANEADRQRLQAEAAAAAKAAAEAETARKAAEAEAQRQEAERQAKVRAEEEARKKAEEQRLAAEAAAAAEAERLAQAKAEAEAERQRLQAEKAAADAAAAEAAAADAAANDAVADAADPDAGGGGVRPPAPANCDLGGLVKLEPAAMLGKMSDGQTAACETTLAAASKMTDKGKVSRLLMVNAFSKGDKATWEQLVKRHLDEIDQSDPDLCYKYALHLSRKGVGRSSGVIRWADVALENRTVWTGDTYTSRVYSLYKLRAAASQKLWGSSEQKHTESPSEDTKGKVDKYRAMTKVMAREWYEYAKVAGKDTTKALQLCMSAAGTKDYCEAG